MAESPITDPEVYEAIDQQLAPEEPEPRKRRKTRKNMEEIPLPLEKLSGREIVEILDFLHRRYLSWMTEAESSKYMTVWKSARDEAIKEILETQSQILEQQNQTISRLENTIKMLEYRLNQAQAGTSKSFLDDPRIRALLFTLLETFLGNNQQYKNLRGLLATVLLPEAFTTQRSEKEEDNKQ